MSLCDICHRSTGSPSAGSYSTSVGLAPSGLPCTQARPRLCSALHGEMQTVSAVTQVTHCKVMLFLAKHVIFHSRNTQARGFKSVRKGSSRSLSRLRNSWETSAKMATEGLVHSTPWKGAMGSCEGETMSQRRLNTKVHRKVCFACMFSICLELDLQRPSLTRNYQYLTWLVIWGQQEPWMIRYFLNSLIYLWLSCIIDTFQ